MERVEVSWDGLRWLIRDGFIHDSICLTKREWCVIKVLQLLSSRDRVFTDVGAHVGFYAVRMSRFYKLVHAIEPNPLSVYALRRNMELNGITNMRIHELAVGEKEGEMLLSLKETGSSLSSNENSLSEKVKVKVMPLDSVIDHTDVMKIDTEGYEEPIVKGAKTLIEEKKPVIIIEHHDLGGMSGIPSNFSRIKQFLRGYVPFCLDGVRYCWVHRDKLNMINEEALKTLIIYHWFSKLFENIQKGRPWYYGLPCTWWWGMSPPDFIENLHEHALKEEEWLSLIIKESES